MADDNDEMEYPEWFPPGDGGEVWDNMTDEERRETACAIVENADRGLIMWEFDEFHEGSGFGTFAFAEDAEDMSKLHKSVRAFSVENLMEMGQAFAIPAGLGSIMGGEDDDGPGSDPGGMFR